MTDGIDAISIQENRSSAHHAGAACRCGTRIIGDDAVIQRTTTYESKPQLRNGWLGSLLLHGLLLCSFLPLFRLSSLTLPKEPFHWDVTLIQSTRPAAEPAQDTTFTETVVPQPTERTPVPPRTGHPIRHAAPSTERIMPIEPHTAEPVAPTAQSDIVSSTTSLQAPAIPSISEKPTPNYPQASDPPPSERADTPANPTTAATSTAQPVVTTANETSAPPSEAPLSPPASVPTAAAAVTPRLDYGWLQQAISRRLEELKRSSRPILDDSRLLRVTVKAVVSREGTLLDFAVVKSSGLDRIDQEAIALVQRAFPMLLDRPLDREQIAMRIPITYSRE